MRVEVFLDHFFAEEQSLQIRQSGRSLKYFQTALGALLVGERLLARRMAGVEVGVEGGEVSSKKVGSRVSSMVLVAFSGKEKKTKKNKKTKNKKKKTLKEKTVD